MDVKRFISQLQKSKDGFNKLSFDAYRALLDRRYKVDFQAGVFWPQDKPEKIIENIRKLHKEKFKSELKGNLKLSPTKEDKDPEKYVGLFILIANRAGTVKAWKVEFASPSEQEKIDKWYGYADLAKWYIKDLPKLLQKEMKRFLP